MNRNILSNLVIIGVRSATTMYSPENKKARKENRPQWALVIKYEGRTVYTACGTEYVSDSSHLVLLPRGCTYEWHCTQAGHYSIIEFESDLTYQSPLVFPIKNGEKIFKMFREMEFRRNLKNPLMQMESIRDLYSILLAIDQAASEKYISQEKQQKIAPAIEYMMQNYQKPLTNDELASLTGLSTVYFRKLFTTIMHQSPIHYMHALRIEKAKEMLKSDYGTLSDIAQSLGYSSLYDFSRDFKKSTGVSPSKYDG